MSTDKTGDEVSEYHLDVGMAGIARQLHEARAEIERLRSRLAELEGQEPASASKYGRWSFEADEEGLTVCRGDHDNSEHCEPHTERLSPHEALQIVNEMRADLLRLSARPAPPAVPMTRDQIRDVFLRNGFTIKEGQADLKEYVYAAAEELLRSATPAVPEGYALVPVEPTVAMCDAACAEESEANRLHGCSAAFLDIWFAMLKAAPQREGGAE